MSRDIGGRWERDASWDEPPDDEPEPREDDDYPDDEIIEDDPPTDEECDREAEDHFTRMDNDLENGKYSGR